MIRLCILSTSNCICTVVLCYQSHPISSMFLLAVGLQIYVYKGSDSLCLMHLSHSARSKDIIAVDSVDFNVTYGTSDCSTYNASIFKNA